MKKTDLKKSSNTEAKKEAPKTGNKKIGAKSVYAAKKKQQSRMRKDGKAGKPVDEFAQAIVDIARVTRVMAGGKRMRFRACVAVGNRKGKVGIGLAKGADVSMAVTKAVNVAKKDLIDVSIVNDTIPHEIFQKTGAAKVLLKPARKGKGVIAGGATRIVLELSGIKNITCKNLGTNNKVNVAKATMAALSNIKKVESKKKPNEKNNQNKELKKNDSKNKPKKVEAKK